MRKRILKIILCPVILLTRLILCAAAFVTSLAGSVIGLTALLFGILSLMAFVTGSWREKRKNHETRFSSEGRVFLQSGG